uniref:Titin n=1 Tax=Xenopus tropicalis TaxID=8364 RepID=A0A6I8QTY6_XENTR
QNIEVLEGEKAEFICSVSKEAYEVQWVKNDTVLESGDKYDISSDGKRRILVVKNCVPKEDEGIYAVMIGSSRAPAELTVVGKHSHFCLTSILKKHIIALYIPFLFLTTEEDLRIVEPIEDIETMEKKSVSFCCKVNRPNATVMWMKNGQEVVLDKRVLYKVDKFKHSLIIKDCGFVDEGEYTVIAGQDKAVAELIITEAPTDFVQHLQDQTVIEFEDAVFTCQLSKEKAAVRWYRNGRELRANKKYQFEKDGSLHRLIIKDCRPEDECEYSCGVDERKSRARLFVEGKQNLYMSYQQIFAPGSDVIFEAELNKDRVEVKWLRNNMIIVQGDKHQMMSEGKVHRLQICEIRPRDQGEYRFIAKDKEARAKLELAGTVLHFTVNLSVPKIKTADQNIVIDAGKPLTMSVPYDAYPKAEAEWKKDDETLSDVHVDTTANDTSFRITETKKADRGRYKIILHNKHGKAEAFINLEVIDVPGPVRNLEVIDTYDGEVSLAWEEPETDGGSKITGYIIERRDIKRKTWVLVTDHADSCEYTVTGLQKGGVEYLFRVSAKNRVGAGEPVETDKPVEAKSPPLNVDVCDVNRFGATITWEPPEYDGGSEITAYIVELRDRASIKWDAAMITKPDELGATLNDVVENKEYIFRVRAENQAGVGKPSAATRAVKIRDPIAEPTMDLSAFKDGLEVIVPEPLKIRVPITGYPVPTATWSVNGNVLESNERVKIQTNAAFAELIISPSERPDKGIYTIELQNTVTSVSGEINVNGIFLTWEVPKYDGGSRIKGYIVEKCQRGTEKWEICVTNLTEGQWYAYRVKALNRMGASKPSKPTDDILATDPQEIFLDVKLLAGITVKAGTKIELPATIAGKPEPRITWNKADALLRIDKRINIESKPGHSTVIIADSTRSDSGTYIVEAVNTSGRATPSDITKDSVTLSWNEPDEDGGSPITGYWVERLDPETGKWVKCNKIPVKDPTYR